MLKSNKSWSQFKNRGKFYINLTSAMLTFVCKRQSSKSMLLPFFFLNRNVFPVAGSRISLVSKPASESLNKFNNARLSSIIYEVKTYHLNDELLTLKVKPNEDRKRVFGSPIATGRESSIALRLHFFN